VALSYVRLEKKSLIHLAHPSLNFKWVKKCEILSRFSPLTRCVFKTKQQIENLKLPPKATVLRFDSNTWSKWSPAALLKSYALAFRLLDLSYVLYWTK